MTADELVALFDLEPSGKDRFVGHSPHNGWKRVFGGQVLAQALVAAERTVAGRDPHSLHAYFLLAGDPREPILFEVERVRDGTQLHDAAGRRPPAGRGDLRPDGLVPGRRSPASTIPLRMPKAPPPEECSDPRQGASNDLEGPARFRMKGLLDTIVADRIPPDRPRRYAPGGPARAPPDAVDPDRRTLAGRSGDPSRGACSICPT